MSLRIIKPGMLTTLQDAGRKGFQHLGIPVGGAMDDLSFRVANLLCGNQPDEAVLEFTFHGAEILVEKDTLMAFTGGGARVFLDEEEIPIGKPIHVKAYTLIRLLPCSRGVRLYLAIAGGFQIEKQMGSYSTYLTAKIGGLEGRALQAGDLLPIKESLNEYQEKALYSLELKDKNYRAAHWSIPQLTNGHTGDRMVRFIKGPEWEWFPPATLQHFLHAPFYVSGQFNRMGYRLLGSMPAGSPPGEMLSTAVTKGTIQVTHNGHLVLLMSDSQTTGGYPRIGQVISVDHTICAQLRPGESIRFVPVEQEEAENLLLQRIRTYKQLEETISEKF